MVKELLGTQIISFLQTITMEEQEEYRSNSSTFTTDLNNSLPELSDVYGVCDISLIGAKFNAVLKSNGGDENTTVTLLG